MEERLDARGLTEAEAIARYKSRNYPKPALTADIVVFSRSGAEWKVLLIERGGHPFIGKLALPGGFANENEPIEETAARELEEETGYRAGKLIELGKFYPACAYSDETIWMYLAKDLVRGESHRDVDEFLDVELIPLQDLVKMVLAGEIPDAKTQIAVLKAAAYEGTSLRRPRVWPPYELTDNRKKG